MQLLPSTWLVTRLDGDGDTFRSPNDLDDASLAAAVYLRAGGADFSTTHGAHAALFHFNRSTAYVTTALELADAYRDGDYGLTRNYLGLQRGRRRASQLRPPERPALRTRSTGSTRPTTHGEPRRHRVISGATSSTPPTRA